jgi:hypothetical protein
VGPESDSTAGSFATSSYRAYALFVRVPKMILGEIG